MRHQFKRIVTINKHDKIWTVRSLTKAKVIAYEFESGMEFEAELFDGRKIQNVITVNELGKNATRVMKMDGFEARQEFMFNRAGFRIIYSAKGKTATQSFKRM